MNKTQQRFEAAKHAMAAMAPMEGYDMSHPDAKGLVKNLTESAVAIADALLAELARTCKESSQVEPEWTQWKSVKQTVQVPGSSFFIICKNEVEASLAAAYHNAEMKRVTGTEGKS
jgi:hypothetical protein